MGGFAVGNGDCLIGLYEGNENGLLKRWERARSLSSD